MLNEHPTTHAAPPPSLSVNVLGPVEVRTAAGPARLGRRERSLLALLALQANRLVPTRVLIDQLWPEHPPATARNAVQVYLSRLRGALGRDSIRSDLDGYALVVDPSRVDALRFEQLTADAGTELRRGRVETAARLARTALALWRGDPLADCASLPFAQAQAAVLTEKRLRALEHRIEADLRLGRGPDVVDELTQLCAGHRFREPFTAALMTALYQAGRQVEALDAYRDYRTMLADELGVDPGHRLQRLHQQILAGDRALASEARPLARPHLRPPPAAATPLVGRDRALADIAAALSGGQIRLLTLHGPGGSGKTRLAAETTRRLARSFDGLTAWVPLAAVTDTDQVLATVAASLGVGADHGRPLPDSIHDLLDRFPILLVLDNGEHLAPQLAAVIADLLDSSSQLTLLVTSRTLLRVPGEHRFTVPPLALPARGADAHETLTAPACALFLDRVRAIRPGQPITDTDAQTVASICVRLDGLPLALELAAARSHVLTLPALLDRLRHRLPLTDADSPATPVAADRHRSLRATLAWSHDLLTAEQRQLLARLSVFHGPFTLEAAEAVNTPSAPDGTLEQLAGLTEASMLNFDQHGAAGQGRFTMLQTVREFASEQLAATAAAVPVRRAHAVRMEAGLEPLLARVPPMPWSAAEAEQIAANHDDIQAALRFSRDQHDPHLLARLALGTSGWWHLAGFAAEGERWLAAAQDAHQHVTPGDHVRLGMLLMLGQLALAQGHLHEAAHHYDTVLADPTLTNHPHHHSQAQIAGAWVDLARGRDATDVVARITAAVAEARTLADPGHLANVLDGGGSALGQLDRLLGWPLLEEAARLGAVHAPVVASSAAINLAELAAAAGETEAAVRWAREALTMDAGNAGAHGRAYALDILGLALLLAGDITGAEPVLWEALSIADWDGDAALLNELLVQFAVLAHMRREHSWADALLAAHGEGTVLHGVTLSGSGRRLLATCMPTVPQARAVLSGRVAAPPSDQNWQSVRRFLAARTAHHAAADVRVGPVAGPGADTA